MSKELERVLQEAMTAQFKTLFWLVPGGTEENH
jgi:hypothetical protein